MRRRGSPQPRFGGPHGRSARETAMKEKTPLREYYTRRAPGYDAIYERKDPARRSELTGVERRVAAVCRGRRVLEVACGTGYWTAVAAREAHLVAATDASPGMLAEARRKLAPDGGVVRFVLADAYRLECLRGEFDAAFAGFWFSHVPKAAVGEFLEGLHRRLRPGARVLLFDNENVPGVGGELTGGGADGDTFKDRRLDDGTRVRVLKNYFGPGDLEALLAPWVEDLDVVHGAYYWTAVYRPRRRPG